MLVIKMEFEQLTKIEIKEIQKNTIIFIENPKDFCKRPYSGNPNGCPNYGKCVLCPPNVGHFSKSINNYNYFYLVYIDFDFREYKNRRLKSENKEWWQVGKRISCLLYWQNSIINILKRKLDSILGKNNDKRFHLLGCGSGFSDKMMTQYQERIPSMEAVGINVFSTCKLNEIKLEIHLEDKIKLVSLIASKEELFGLDLKKTCPICKKEILAGFSTSKESIREEYHCFFCGYIYRGAIKYLPVEQDISNSDFKLLMNILNRKKPKCFTGQKNTLDNYMR